MQPENETDNNNNNPNNSEAILEGGYQETKFDPENESKTNLIVNYLPPTMTEAQLKELFQVYGVLESVKLMTDKMTRVSLGYGFVKFTNEQDAKIAMEALNGKNLENKTLRVNLAKNGKLKKTNLYIAYLSNQINDKFALKNYFEKFGRVTDTKLLSDERGISKGVGFVKFENREDAEKAIQAMNGSMDPNISNGSHPLVVKFSDKDKKKDLFKGKIKNPYRTPFQKNYQMFQGYRYSPYGNAYDRVPNPYQNNNYQPNPYPNNYQQDNYMQQPNFGYQQPPYNPNPLPPPNVIPNKNFPPMMPNGPDGVFCLFVYNLPPEADDNLVFRLFSPYGNISSVKVMKDPNTGQCKGFAFVNYFKYEDAFSAINGLNNHRYNNKNLQVSFKKSNN